MITKFINFLVYSNLYLAFGALFVTYITAHLSGLSIFPDLLFIPFAGVMFVYNLNRQTDIVEDKINVPKRFRFTKQFGKFLLVLSTFLYILALVFGFLRNLITFLIILIPGIVSFFYCILRLKRILLIKNLLVGFAWGMASLLVGAYFSSINFIIIFLFVFFSIEFFINTVIFDIKDIRGDMAYRIRTLPIVIGIKYTKYVCHIINSFLALALMLAIYLTILPLYAIFLILFSIYILMYIWLSNKFDGTIFYGIFVDGEFLFMATIFFILSLLGLF